MKTLEDSGGIQRGNGGKICHGQKEEDGASSVGKIEVEAGRLGHVPALKRVTYSRRMLKSA